MKRAVYRHIVTGIALLSMAACLPLHASEIPIVELWSTPVYRGLLATIEKAKGEPFNSIRLIVDDKIAHPAIFPAAIEKMRSDELFLLSPRNTKVRPSHWDRNFRWNLAEGGRDYILHVYSGDNEIFKRLMGEAHRAGVSEHDVILGRGVVYSWDISLCVGRCGLHLSSRPALRPIFYLLSEAEEAAVAGDLETVSSWCRDNAVEPQEETALVALVLEHWGLYMEEDELLAGAIKKKPGSMLLTLVRSGALYAMNSPFGARDLSEKARVLYEKNAGGAGTAP
jgi:hypothetical protein